MMRTRQRTRPAVAPPAVLAVVREPRPTINSSADLALLDDLQSVALEPDIDRSRGVRKKHHVADAEIAQNLRADADLDQSALFTFRLSWREARTLPDPIGNGLRPEIADEHQDAASFLLDRAHGLRDERVAGDLRTGADPQHIGQHVDRVHTNQHWPGFRQVALH